MTAEPKITEAGNEPWDFPEGVSLDALDTVAVQFGASVEAEQFRAADVARGIGQHASDRSPADQPSATRAFKQGGPGREEIHEPTEGYSGGEAGRGLPVLEGAPTVRGVSGPDPRLVSVTDKVRRRQRNKPPAARHVRRGGPPARAGRIADAYAGMEHDPRNPEVAEAYRTRLENRYRSTNGLDNTEALER